MKALVIISDLPISDIHKFRDGTMLDLYHVYKQKVNAQQTDQLTDRQAPYDNNSLYQGVTNLKLGP